MYNLALYNAKVARLITRPIRGEAALVSLPYGLEDKSANLVRDVRVRIARARRLLQGTLNTPYNGSRFCRSLKNLQVSKDNPWANHFPSHTADNHLCVLSSAKGYHNSGLQMLLYLTLSAFYATLTAVCRDSVDTTFYVHVSPTGQLKNWGRFILFCKFSLQQFVFPSFCT